MKKFNLFSDKFLVFILILSGCFQNIELINITDGFGLKLYHVVSILLFFRLITKTKGKIKFPPFFINLFFVFILALSFFMYFIYGFNSLCINYIFIYYLMILIINIGYDFTFDDWISILKRVSIFMIISVYINLLLNFSQIRFFLSGNTERIVLDTFFGGGINIEATWISLLGLFFLKDEKSYIYMFFSMIICMLYSSRSGIIVNVLFFLIIFFKKNNGKNVGLKKIILLILVFAGLIILNNKTGLFNYIINRFCNLGNENGSLGRLNMWKNVVPAFLQNPFGYGLGNAVKAITLISGIPFRESNVHNMFFQMLLDCGFLGFFMYFFMNFYFIVKEKKNIFINPFVAFIFIYIILSLIEFRGADFLIYVILSIYFLIKCKGCKNNG